MHDGCGCALGTKGGPCSGQFTEQVVFFNLNNCRELSSVELDLVILPNIQAFTHSESIGKKRSRNPRCNFYYQSQPICKEMFLHFYGLSDSRFRRLKEQYQNHGISPRTHGNAKRLPQNTLPQSAIEAVDTFLSNYVKENAICLPGRIPGFKNDDIKVLSSSESKTSVWRAYDTTCKTADMRAVSCRKFLQLWEQFYPNVVVAKPMTDICLTCQQNTSKLQRSANLSDREKSECLKAHQDHLNCAQTEREHYKNSCANSEKALETIGTETLLNHESRDACSLNATAHSVATAQSHLLHADEIYQTKFNSPNTLQSMLMHICWETVEYNTLLQQAQAIHSRLDSLLPFLNPASPRVVDVTASLNNMANDWKEYLQNVFVKKRRPAATHVLMLMVSEERRNKKPYALPVQYVPYYSIHDQYIRDLSKDVKTEMTKLGMKTSW